MQETKVQWHPGFVAAMNLEFSQNKKDLLFEKEYNLNTKPLEVDLLIIRKDGFTSISNEIGKIFRGHNLLEFKSPKDHLDIDVFYKTVAYASLYKSYGRTVDERKAEDITISLVRENKPQKLFSYFKEHGFTVSNPYQGIYYIEGQVLFPTQIIVTKELDMEKHIWLGALAEGLEKTEIKTMLENIRGLTEQEDREFADSVLEVSVRVNQQTIEEMRGDGSMSQVLMEIMEPQIRLIRQEELQRGRKEGRKEGRQEGQEELARNIINVSRGNQMPDAEIRKLLINCNVNEALVERLLHEKQ